MHRRLELTFVCLQRSQLQRQTRRDILHVVRLLGLPEQQHLRPMRRQALRRVEVRVAGGHHGVTSEIAGMAVIRMSRYRFHGS